MKKLNLITRVHCQVIDQDGEYVPFDLAKELAEAKNIDVSPAVQTFLAVDGDQKLMQKFFEITDKIPATSQCLEITRVLREHFRAEEIHFDAEALNFEGIFAKDGQRYSIRIVPQKSKK